MSDRSYQHAQRLANGSDPFEAGTIGNLADNECPHGRLPDDPTRRCGCWREEGAVLKVVETPRQRPKRMSAETAQTVVELRRMGMNMPDIVIALDYFIGVEINYNQVRHLTYSKLKVKPVPGARPGRATDRRTA